MYAIVALGPAQYKVAEGDVIDTFLLDAEEGKSLTFDQVLLVENTGNVQIGQPFVKGATVAAEVVKHHRGEKLIAFKFRRRKHRARIRGHRQEMTQLRITKITAN